MLRTHFASTTRYVIHVHTDDFDHHRIGAAATVDAVCIFHNVTSLSHWYIQFNITLNRISFAISFGTSFFFSIFFILFRSLLFLSFLFLPILRNSCAIKKLSFLSASLQWIQPFLREIFVAFATFFHMRKLCEHHSSIRARQQRQRRKRRWRKHTLRERERKRTEYYETMCLALNINILR